MLASRSSGILLHPTSFPSRFGIGDLGKEAYQFLDFLEESKQQIWQILPLGPTGYGNSPYMCYSALAGNYLLVDLENLVEAGWLNPEDLRDIPEFPLDRVDYDLVIAYKTPLLQKAATNFQAKATAAELSVFQDFCQQQQWLNDYALFMALKDAHDGESWHLWESDIAQRQPEAMQQWRAKLSQEIYHHKFTQYLFFSQWQALKAYANEKGIKIFGDIPIYVSHDSADVWAQPEIFGLDEETGEVAQMAGVPPDYFSETGQLWGNPVYNWEQLAKTGFQWWIDRVKATLEQVDILRIDHFRGFEAFWAVPAGEETAINGEWIKAPGEELFTVLADKLGKLPIVAEDLGVITPEVEALRDRFQFPGMKILQFAFDSDRANPFLPFNYTQRNCVVYTGTHDNDTTVGWYTARSQEEQARVVDFLGCIVPEGIHWSLIRLAMSSVANTAIFPLQDIFGLGTDARMNTPSVAEGNWMWRYSADMLIPWLSNHLQHLTYLYGRGFE
jgi:4-alpha-glucanotransferase